jgi:hypothetical protein
MTLVAAFKHREIPVLIGDMALSVEGMRSLRKKAYIIAPNFAVAWAGHFIVAKSVITELRETFATESATKLSVENFFKKYHSSDFGRLHTNFIGWIVENGDQYCFLWNCLYPQEVFYRGHYFEGTGEQYFTTLRGQKGQEGGSGLPPNSSFVLSAINQIAQARFDESIFRDTWDLSFGASYDIIVLMNGRFGYVGSIVYVGWDYHWDSTLGTGRLEQAPVVIKHTSRGGYSILQEALHGKLFDGATTNYLSRPVYDDMLGTNLIAWHLTLSPKHDFFANYFRFWENDRVIFKTLLTLQRPTQEDSGLKITRDSRGAYFFDFDTSVLDRIYREHFAR